MQALAKIENRDGQVIHMFLANKARRSANTARVYESELKKFFGFVNKPMGSITLADLQGYADSLKHLALASQARALTTIRSLFNFAHKLGYLRLNPAQLLELPKVQVTSENRFLTRSELGALLQSAKCKNPTARLATAFLALTGLRISELVSIRWCDFFEDLEGNIGVRVQGKGGKVRIVKIRLDLWEEAKAYRVYRGRNPELDNTDESFLFINRNGEKVSDVYLRRLVKECAGRAGIRKDVTPHWLRHSYATLALAGGASLPQVQRDLGHSNIAVTGRYLHAVAGLSRTGADYVPVQV